MKTFTLITALSLCSISWISVSLSESHIVKVQSGQDVTLQCKKTSKYAADSFWFRLVKKTKIICISAMTGAKSELKYCDGFQSGKFNMSTNTSTVSLKIKQVDLSDSGLYYCGIYTKGLPVFSEIHLNIEVSESHIVKVQPGQDVTLQCNNPSKHGSETFWSRLVNKTKIVCISAITGAKRELKYCDGFQSGKFEMSANISTVSLKIKQVDLSDSGPYYCGIYFKGLPVFSEINIEGSDESHDDVDKTSEKSDVILKLMSVILGGVTAVLVMVIIGLLVKNRKLKTAQEEQNPQPSENGEEGIYTGLTPRVQDTYETIHMKK